MRTVGYLEAVGGEPWETTTDVSLVRSTVAGLQGMGLGKVRVQMLLGPESQSACGAGFFHAAPHDGSSAGQACT